MSLNKPILIVGAHRSGTTWVGKVVASAPRTSYLQEPFNINNPFNLGLFPYWYYCISDTGDLNCKKLLEQMISFSFNYSKALQMVNSIKSLGRFFKYAKLNMTAQIMRRDEYRTIIKDPLALFSSEWFYSTFNSDVLVLIRHPAAFVNSILRVGWGHPFSHFLMQDLLMKNELVNFHDEIYEYSIKEKSLLDQAILLWKITHSQINKLKEKHHNEWLFVKHEDLSIDPFHNFSIVFQHMQIEYGEKTREVLLKTTSSSNPRDARSVHTHKRDSKANAYAWKRKLSSEDINYIRAAVEPISSCFYSNDEW